MTEIEIHENDIVFENTKDWSSFCKLITNIELIQEYKSTRIMRRKVNKHENK